MRQKSPSCILGCTHSQIFVTLDISSHILPTLQEAAMKQLSTALTDASGKNGKEDGNGIDQDKAENAVKRVNSAFKSL